MAVATAAAAAPAVMATATILRDKPAIQPRTPDVAAPTPNRVTTMAYIAAGKSVMIMAFIVPVTIMAFTVLVTIMAFTVLVTIMAFTALAKWVTIAACIPLASRATTNASIDLV
jgi:hypothetical protein